MSGIATVALVLQSINAFVLSVNATENGVIHSTHFSNDSNANILTTDSTGKLGR